jgi:DNA-binding SARP family transcriptional activator
LHTFGAAFVRGPSGEPLTGAAAQRRTIALLSLLAVAGDAGLSRDRLVALLWPDAGTERGRHSLTQALYSARRALGVDDLFATGAEVRLNPARLSSDVQEFEAALAAGDFDRAVAVYAGPFLDGFFYSGSNEFEQWASAQRDRLETRAAHAYEMLASAAEASGALDAAVAWRRRLVGLRPLDSGAAVKFMTLLARTGDRAGALQHARVHESLLQEQMGLAPEPVVMALAERLREPVEWTPPVTVADRPPVYETTTFTPDAGAAVGSDGDVVAHALDAAPAGPEVEAEAEAARLVSASAPTRAAVGVWVPRASPSRLWLGRALIAALVVTLVGVGVVIGRGRSTPSPVVRELAVRQRVVVAPFRVVGADASLAYLRDGMVELLAARLADDSAARTVDAGAVLGAWRAAGLTGTMDVSRDTIVKLAARLGAERVVVGSVVGRPSSMIVRASVIPVASGTVSAEATVTGPVDSLTTLIDRLAARLLASEAGEDELLAQQTTASLPALRAFLSGQAALRAASYAAALRAYETALRHDGSFALAALQAAVAADRLIDPVRVRRHAAVAWVNREALSERDRAVLAAMLGERFPMPSTAPTQRAAWQRLVDLVPRSADAWLMLGTRLHRDGAVAGVSASSARATDAFRRALAAADDPSAHGMLALLDAESPDSTRATPDSIGPFAPFVRWHRALVRGDTVELERLRDTLYLLGPANLRAIAMAAQYDTLGTVDGAHALELLDEREMRTADRVDVILGRHSQAMLDGDRRAVSAAIARLRRAQPGTSAARLAVLDALHGDGDSAVALAALRELASVTGADPSAVPATSETWAANVCVIGQWNAAHGDTAAVARAIPALHAAPFSVPAVTVDAAPGACATLLDATLAVLRRSPDAGARVAHLDSLVWTPQVVGDLALYAPLAIARLHERLGDVPGALDAVRRRGYLWGWPRYGASSRREEARLAGRVGAAASATPRVPRR